MNTWRTWWSRIATIVLLFVLLAPFAVTFGARSLADVPTESPAAELPPLPTPGPDATASLDGLVDPLPLVVRDLPDDESIQAVEAYDQATLLNSNGGRDMFNHAWSSLVTDPAYDDEMALLAAALMPESITSSLAHSVPATNERVSALISSVMPALSRESDNADRLNNAAVGLFLYETEMLHGAQPFGENCGIRGSGWFHYGALLLLQETDRAFEPSRAVLLNLGFLTSLTVDAGAGEATVPVSRLLAQDPSDHTARLLLGSLVTRQIRTSDALDSALEILSPLLDVEETEALGYSALGDAYLAAALERRGVSPFLAHAQAMEALAHYDLALTLTTDPGVHNGRAAALDLLEAPQEAIATLDRALDYDPESINLRVGMALLYQQVGNYDMMREHARAASVLTSDAWDPQVANLRFVRAGDATFETADPGYMGFSYGFEKVHVPWFRVTCMAGGGFFVSLNLFPAEDPWISDPRRMAFVPRAASELTLSASILLGDAEGAALDWDEWDRSRRNIVVEAANLVTGQNAPEELEQASWTLAVTELEDAGQYARASEICERFDEYICAGINAYLAHDYQRAADLLNSVAEPAIQRYTNADRPGRYDMVGSDGQAILRAADAARAAGDISRAREMYSAVASRDDRSVMFAAIAYTKLAELELDGGDPRQATSHLDAALGIIHSPEYRDELERALPASIAPAAQAMQVAHNNRGIARLWEVKQDSRGAPDCTKHQELCLRAQEDFTTALDADPYNPVYLLNMGWVARLLGDSGAARAYLTESTTIDASLYPSYNDLGVFAASDGDWQKAHAAFMDAAAANPDYDLALWNLGVLEMGRGGIGLLSGQGYLARAIEQNRALRDNSEIPTFQKDERIYRVALDSPVGNGFRFSQASSVAAGLLGTISFIAAIKLTLKNLLSDKTIDLIEALWARKARLLGRHADTLRRLGSGIVLMAAQVTDRVRTTLRREPFRTVMSRLAGLRPPERWRAPLAWIATMMVLIGVTVWPVWRDGAYVRPALVMLSLFAVLSALVVHEAAHYLAARMMRAQITYTQWSPGIVLAPILMPFNLNGGPFMCQRVEGVDKERAWRIYLSGPAANLVAAILMYGLFQTEPLPMLRLLATVHLAAAGYALLPFQPLDGAHLIKRRPAVASVMGFMVTFPSILLVVGIM